MIICRKRPQPWFPGACKVERSNKPTNQSVHGRVNDPPWAGYAASSLVFNHSLQYKRQEDTHTEACCQEEYLNTVLVCRIVDFTWQLLITHTQRYSADPKQGSAKFVEPLSKHEAGGLILILQAGSMWAMWIVLWPIWQEFQAASPHTLYSDEWPLPSSLYTQKLKKAVDATIWFILKGDYHCWKLK